MAANQHNRVRGGPSNDESSGDTADALPASSAAETYAHQRVAARTSESDQEAGRCEAGRGREVSYGQLLADADANVAAARRNALAAAALARAGAARANAAAATAAAMSSAAAVECAARSCANTPTIPTPLPVILPRTLPASADTRLHSADQLAASPYVVSVRGDAIYGDASHVVSPPPGWPAAHLMAQRTHTPARSSDRNAPSPRVLFDLSAETPGAVGRGDGWRDPGRV